MKPNCLNVTLSLVNSKLARTIISFIGELDDLLKEKFDIDDSIVMSWSAQSKGLEPADGKEGNYRYSLVEVELEYMVPNNPLLRPELWASQKPNQVAKITVEHGESDHRLTDFRGYKDRQSLDQKKDDFFKKIAEIFKERSPVSA